MNRLSGYLKGLGLVAVFLLISLPAWATPISGAISLAGNVTVNGGGAFNAPGATTLSFPNKVLATQANGTFAPLVGNFNVTMNPITYEPSPVIPIQPLWTVTASGVTYKFDLTSFVVHSVDQVSIDLRGNGMAHVTGFDDTPGTWIFTANSLGGTLSFSSSNAVPEPATLTLLGAGLLGLCLFSKRRLG